MVTKLRIFSKFKILLFCKIPDGMLERKKPQMFQNSHKKDIQKRWVGSATFKRGKIFRGCAEGEREE